MSYETCPEFDDLVKRVGYDRACEMVGRLSDGGWIACSERMPEPDRGVLTFGKCHANALVAAWDPQREAWFCYAGEPVCSCADITHWMPLPAPPAADRETGEG